MKTVLDEKAPGLGQNRVDFFLRIDLACAHCPFPQYPYNFSGIPAEGKP